MTPNTTTRNRTDLAASFLGGAIAGTALAILFAPASGADTRRAIRRSAERGQEKLDMGAKELVRRAVETKEAAVATAKELAEGCQDRIKEGQERIAQEKEGVAAAIAAGKAAYREKVPVSA